MYPDYTHHPPVQRTADHDPTAELWPAPETAYASAPGILAEMAWVTRTVNETGNCTELGRDYYLRKAALLDRIALRSEPDAPGEETEVAVAAALVLLDTDQPGVICDPRAYVRQQYARWTTDQ
ncbi:hypothetical protein ACLGI4_15325 [Streptomyces sp. HMX112]|uniref:hypothetical protein n=1 Tax=Streptomyces sp. HMX112 TaxID=3390850 RepID=UPI003A81394E